jgi:5-methylcytosine-specific restriction endonuclease McrA
VKKPRKELTSRKWKKQRELVFRTKGHDCYVCGEWADAIDHVISAKRGGGDNIENLEPICKRCNSRKGSREYGVFLGRTPTPPVQSLSGSDQCNSSQPILNRFEPVVANVCQ